MTGGPCPCGSGVAYAGCCGPIHESGIAPTAERLMRSRFSAFALGPSERSAAYLLRSWQSSTRPADADFWEDGGGPDDAAGRTRWRRLQIVDVVDGGADDATGIVEFRASFVVEGAGGPAGAPRAGLLHERSRFVREPPDGRWVYVDGDVLD